MKTLKFVLFAVLICFTWGLHAQGAQHKLDISNGGINEIASPDGLVLIIGGSNGKIWKAVNGIESAQLMESNLPNNAPITCIAFLNSLTGYASGGGQLSKTTDGGTTWVLQSFSAQGGVNRIKFFSATDIQLVTNNAGIYRTTNGGASWINQSQELLEDFTTLEYIGDNGFIGGSFVGHLGKTTNRGLNWTFSTTTWKGYCSAVYNNNIYFAGNGNGGMITYSSNLGETWNQTSFPLVTGFNDISFTGNTGYAVGYRGMGISGGSQDTAYAYKYQNGNWLKINVGPTRERFECVACVNGKAYIGCSEGWVYVIDVVGITQNSTEIPAKYELKQNYPNPFNPVTNIKFSIPKAGNVKISVFDIKGSEIAVLLNEARNIGTHTVDFNASNLASGVYYYRIEANDFVATKPMMLVK